MYKVGRGTGSKDPLCLSFLNTGKRSHPTKNVGLSLKRNSQVVCLGSEIYWHMTLWMLNVHMVSRPDKLRKEKVSRALNRNIRFLLQEIQTYKLLETGSIFWGILMLHFLFECSSLEFCWKVSLAHLI